MSANISLLVVLLGLKSIDHQVANGTFLVPRTDVCRDLEVISANVTFNQEIPNCISFDWSDFWKYSVTVTSIIDDETGESFKLYQGTLPTYGKFDTSFSPDLTYKCPPDNYNYFSYATSYCETKSNMTLMVFYVGESDNKLYRVDTILSGEPFPAILEYNEPPFGMTRFNFKDGIVLRTKGQVQICDQGASVSFPGLNKTNPDLNMIGNYMASGFFKIANYPNFNA
jgi:hypothetical protein